MRILEIVSAADVNGAVVHCLLLARELARGGHDVTLLARPGAWIARQLAGEPISIVDSDLHRWPPDELRRVSALAKERGIDVLHTHMSRAHFFGVLLRRQSGIPCVATAHHRRFQLHWRLNDAVIAVSEATARFHRRFNLVPASRLAVVPNFVDPTAFTRGRREDVRRELGVGKSAPLLGAVGDLVPGKGLVYLLRALAIVVRNRPAARLALIGAGPDAHTRRLRAEAEKLAISPHILWLGYRPDVPELLSGLDLLVHPSTEESMSLVVLEAMAASLPVVATRVGGIPECVADGDTGLLVPPRDPAALAAAVERALADPARALLMGEVGRRRVVSTFSVERQVPRVLEVLEQAARRGAAERRRP